jgi:hypothetical protein
MVTRVHINVFGYTILLVGLVLAFVSAVVPFYDAGYQLRTGVLLAGLLPYLLYGMALVLLPRTMTIAAGLLLLVVHAWLVIRERFIDHADYGDGMIYYLPVVLTLLLIPLLVKALHAPWR